jgi:hypothetical protein
MQDIHLFEYAVIRVVPRVEREEFLNVGVVLYCPQQHFLKTIFTLNEERLRCFLNYLNIEEVKEHLHAFEQISAGGPHAGPIGMLDIASRFRWLTATRSTVVQSSKVHPGLCADAQVTLTRLHERLVL